MDVGSSVFCAAESDELDGFKMYHTQATTRIGTFMSDVNIYAQMFRIARRELSEEDAKDVVHDTYIDLIGREHRGLGHFSEVYCSTYEAYVFGVLRSRIKMKRKVSDEITEADFISFDEAKSDEGYLSRIASSESVEDSAFQEFNEFGKYNSLMDACEGFLATCNDTNTKPELLFKAIICADEMHSDAMKHMFADLGKAGRKNSGIISAITDFVRIYGAYPKETKMCLSQLGVAV